VEHLRDNFQFLQHEADSLLLDEGRVAFAAAVGVEGERLFQVGGDAQVIDDEAACLASAPKPAASILFITSSLFRRMCCPALVAEDGKCVTYLTSMNF
jgi:hypothetical protein